MNKGKSNILFSPTMTRDAKRYFKDQWGLKSLKADLVYLGSLLLVGKWRSKAFSKLKNRIQGRLEGLQSKVLSKAAKATLIRSVALSIPVYTMSTFRIPKLFVRVLTGL